MTEETLNTEVTEEVIEDVTAGTEEQETKAVDSEKVIEKLQKRIGKEQAEKNETKTQLEQALARIGELEKGRKSIKDKSEEEKLAEAQKSKDDEIETLRNQIKLAEVTQQADEVLKESGLAVGRDVLGMVVSTDEEKTYSNVKALINLLNDQQKQWETKRNTGITPRDTPSNVKTITKAQIMNITDDFERKQKIAENPQLFGM